MNVELFNAMFGTPRTEMSVLKKASKRKSISNAFIECEFGDIVYNYVDPSYNLTYKNIEIDIDYSYNELERGYILKGALYDLDQIIAFRSIVSYSLRDGLKELCEEMINKYIKKSL